MHTYIYTYIHICTYMHVTIILLILVITIMLRTTIVSTQHLIRFGQAPRIITHNNTIKPREQRAGEEQHKQTAT